KAGRAIGIFVQGTRNAGDAAALDGASYLAQRAGVPLVPAAIWREGRAFHVAFGPPILPTGRTREDATALTQQVVQEIGAMIPSAARVEACRRPGPGAAPPRAVDIASPSGFRLVSPGGVCYSAPRVLQPTGGSRWRRARREPSRKPTS